MTTGHGWLDTTATNLLTDAVLLGAAGCCWVLAADAQAQRLTNDTAERSDRRRELQILEAEFGKYTNLGLERGDER